MPPLVQAALLGVVQGITEFLPVSSTAHLLIGSRLLGFQDPGGVFTVMIQFGSILAIMWLYRAKIAAVVRGLPSDPEARRFAAMILIAVVPALVAGALFSDYVKTVLYNTFAVMAAAFVAGGVVMLVIERFRPTPTIADIDRTPFTRALAIGVCQTLALIPGVSRSGATIVGGMAAGLERAAAAEFSFFLAMPTLAAAFAHDLLEVRGQLAPERALEIGVGFVAAFISSVIVVKPFLAIVQRSGFAPFAWYRIVLGVALYGALKSGVALMQWLRRSFIAGFFVTVPLFISVAAIIWMFGVVDGLTGPFYNRLLGRRIPGLGLITTGAVILMVGAIATNVIGRRILQRGEYWLMRVPVFRTIYAPVKQLVAAFSPDNEFGFKRVVMVEDPRRGYVLGFLTREFVVDRGSGPEPMLAVYVPTNHLYLGDVVICDRERATFPEIAVEDGIKIFLTGGMALPPRVRV